MYVGSAISGYWNDLVIEFLGDFFDKFHFVGEPAWVLPLAIILFFLIYGALGAIVGHLIGKLMHQ